MAKKYIDLSGLTYYDEKIKAYVDAKVAEAGRGKLTFAVVDTLPTPALASQNVVYLVSRTGNPSDNVRDEYILVGSGASASMELIGTTAVDVSGKANKSEMYTFPGRGDNADKTTIQLKSGTYVNALNSHQDISGKSDTASPLVAGSDMTGHIAGLDSQGYATDTGIPSTGDYGIAKKSDLEGITDGEINKLFPFTFYFYDEERIIDEDSDTSVFKAASGWTWRDWATYVPDPDDPSDDFGHGDLTISLVTNPSGSSGVVECVRIEGELPADNRFIKIETVGAESPYVRPDDPIIPNQIYEITDVDPNNQ